MQVWARDIGAQGLPVVDRRLEEQAGSGEKAEQSHWRVKYDTGKGKR